MPCHNPLQAVFSVLPSGKKQVKFSNVNARLFAQGLSLVGQDNFAVPCGRCMDCRLERSRQTALRCLHESKMYYDNCFVTLTFDDDHLVKMCPLKEGGYSLVRKHTQDFMKKLRQKFSRGFYWTDSVGNEQFYQSEKVRVYGCGEYGDRSGRPHYHFCLFNCTFPDRKYLKLSKIGFKYFNSDVLSSLWSYGHAVATDFSFETAAYVARYCTKKVTGKMADEHYKGRLPEFSVYSNRPGIGKPWYDLYGKSDVLPTDSCVVRGALCKPPRYYDKLYERDDPEAFVLLKARRMEKAADKADDNTFERLRTKEKCMDARMKLLIRSLE